MKQIPIFPSKDARAINVIAMKRRLHGLHEEVRGVRVMVVYIYNKSVVGMPRRMGS